MVASYRVEIDSCGHEPDDTVRDDRVMAPEVKQGEVVSTALALLDAMHKHLAVAAERVDLTVSQAMLLRSLGEPASMSESAEAMACDPSNVTGLIDRLEKRGLVVRRPDPDDRRVRLLVLTAEGRRTRARFERALAKGMPPFAGLDADDARRLHGLLSTGLPVADSRPAQ